MAWTTPRTWTVGDLVTAGMMNANVRDNLGQLWRELGYAETTSGLTVSATTEATAQQYLTVTVSPTGSIPILIETFIPYVQPVTLVMKDGATVLGSLRAEQGVYTSGTSAYPVRFDRRIASPVSGSRAFTISAFVPSGTKTLSAGAGGSGVFVPAYIRVMERGG